MMFLYTNEHGSFLNIIIKGDIELATIIEINLNTQHIKLSTWDVQCAIFDNGNAKGITPIEKFPDGASKTATIDFLFDEILRSSLW